MWPKITFISTHIVLTRLHAGFAPAFGLSNSGRLESTLRHRVQATHRGHACQLSAESGVIELILARQCELAMAEKERSLSFSVHAGDRYAEG
jgi:hypothetical protein